MENINEKYKDEVEKAYLEIRDIFGFDIEYTIVFHETREAYEKAAGKSKTPAWMIATASNVKKTVNIVNPLLWEKEGAHKIDELFELLKHEITHLFTSQFAKNKRLPLWLTEGLAYYLSGQYKRKNNIAIEQSFCSKLDTPYGWGQFVNFGAYDLASRFVTYLCEVHSFEKVKELIKEAPVNYEYRKFDRAFKNVFGKSINEIENDFIESLP